MFALDDSGIDISIDILRLRLQYFIITKGLSHSGGKLNEKLVRHGSMSYTMSGEWEVSFGTNKKARMS